MFCQQNVDTSPFHWHFPRTCSLNDVLVRRQYLLNSNCFLFAQNFWAYYHTVAELHEESIPMVEQMFQGVILSGENRIIIYVIVVIVVTVVCLMCLVLYVVRLRFKTPVNSSKSDPGFDTKIFRFR